MTPDEVRTAALNAAVLAWMGITTYERDQTIINTAKQFAAYISGAT